MRDIKREIKFFLKNLDGGKVFRGVNTLLAAGLSIFFQKLSHMSLGTSKDIYLLKSIMTIAKE